MCQYYLVWFADVWFSNSYCLKCISVVIFYFPRACGAVCVFSQYCLGTVSRKLLTHEHHKCWCPQVPAVPRALVPIPVLVTDGCTVALVSSQAAGLWQGRGTQLAWAETQPCPKQLLPKKWLWRCSVHPNVPSPGVLLCQTMLLFLCKFLAAALYFNWKASALFLIILLVKLAENFKSGCCSIDSLFPWCLPILFPIIFHMSVSTSLTNLNVYPVLEHGIFFFFFNYVEQKVFVCN